MDYPTLMLYLENQLDWLKKKGCGHLNIEKLPQVELKRVIQGLKTANLCAARPSEQVSQAAGVQIKELRMQLASSSVSGPPEFETAIPQFLDTESHSSEWPLTDSGSEVSADSLADLEKKYCTCQRCPLGDTRKKFVFGSGNSKARLLFIGEGPGADEDAQGLPFVGRAGRLLTSMIEVIGIDRPDVYVTNIVKCRPPGNRNPTPEEIACCQPILDQQVSLINPDLIVTLGNVPLKTLIPGSPGITKVRGQRMSYQRWPLIPTFHPAYLLRNRNALDQAWEDFRSFGAQLHSGSEALLS
ncbi:MAG: uracil-DNA glycosylase [SAR324 cluster bacterium]|nr:uracil-DNA glycosylase [SAR324 cluster bacterium]MDP7629874.1 uracil-DNA glycosylase [SAR324 cluster bacterium]